jgi:hypothetical protein
MWLSGLKLDVKKSALICLAEFSTSRTQQPICRSAHLLTIGIAVIAVKHRFQFLYQNFAGLI